MKVNELLQSRLDRLANADYQANVRSTESRGDD